MGYVSGKKAPAQIAKDRALVDSRYAKKATWHFFASETNGKIGAAPEALRLWEEAGITVIVHWPTVGRVAG